jgi:hypothetical protein
MKKIKIRFIERGNPTKDYLIQKKTWLGWADIGYSIGTCSGDSIWYLYCKDTKEELLQEVLEHHYKIDRRFVNIVEYPSIKKY